MSFTDLESFLRSITESKDFVGKKLHFNFHSNPKLPAFCISTCGCQVDVSALIDVEESAFMAAFISVMVEGGHDFNMP